MKNDRMKKIVGANLSCSIETLSTPLAVEMYINTKGKFIDFSVTCENEDLRATFVTLLESGIGSEFLSFFKIDSISSDSDSKYHLFYWWQLLDEVTFFLSPGLSEFISLKSSELVCRCFNIYKEDIVAAIARGAENILAITNLTKAGGGCGSCQSDIQKFFDLEERTEFKESGTSQSKKSKQKRMKIRGVWPSELLLGEIFPALEEYNLANNCQSEIVELIENHLYIRSKAKIEKLEDFVLSCGDELLLFYV